MKTSPKFLVTLFTVLAITEAHAMRWYSPSTGSWFSRDPIEERGGKNLYEFVSNQPLTKYDRLGLADYVYQEATTPSGGWVVRMSDIDVPDEGTLHGFRSQFLPIFDNSKCPCKPENIVLVQAVHNSIDGYVMDNRAAYKKYRHIKGTPIPEYYLLSPAWLIRLRSNPLEIVDAPLRAHTEKDDYIWQFEDCAVCRRTLKDGTVIDRVEGCVRFDFIRHIDGTAELSPGKTSIRAGSQAPTKLWRKAFENWKEWTNN